MDPQEEDQIPATPAESDGALPGDDVLAPGELAQTTASLAARSLASREIAAALSNSAGGTAPDQPPAALASLVLYVLEAASAFSDAEQALCAGKRRLKPDQARELRRLLRLGHQALSEVGQLLGSEPNRGGSTKLLVITAHDEPRMPSDES
jgi:ABC-type transporter Mla subunit MlaD